MLIQSSDLSQVSQVVGWRHRRQLPDMTERRFTEQEAAAIFERAADAQASGGKSLAPAEGMTLAELQAIGAEVGIPAELVAKAATSLARAGSAGTTRTFLGLPIGVGRTVELGRKLSEEEWERLVVDLRETFEARGVIRSEGSFRQWTNGNLQALLEPTPAGHRLRLKTYKSDVRVLMTAGIGSVAVGAVMGALALLVGPGEGAAGPTGLLIAMGLGLIGLGGWRLAGWARLRRRQMEEIAARIAEPPE